MKYQCIHSGVVLSKEIWQGAGYSFSKLVEVEFLNGQWVEK